MHNDGATTQALLTTADGFEPFPLDHPGASWILRDQITSSETFSLFLSNLAFAESDLTAPELNLTYSPDSCLGPLSKYFHSFSSVDTKGCW